MLGKNIFPPLFPDPWMLPLGVGDIGLGLGYIESLIDKWESNQAITSENGIEFEYDSSDKLFRLNDSEIKLH